MHQNHTSHTPGYDTTLAAQIETYVLDDDAWRSRPNVGDMALIAPWRDAGDGAYYQGPEEIECPIVAVRDYSLDAWEVDVDLSACGAPYRGTMSGARSGARLP